MADSFSVVAMLSAKDNMSSAFNKVASSAQSLGAKIKNTVGLGAAMQVGMRAVNTALSSMTSHISAAVDRYDQLNAFPKVMKNLGIETKASNVALKEINKGIKGLPTSLDTATRGVTRFTSANGNIKKSTKYFLAMNNAIIAGNQSAELQSSAVEQLSQAYSKGKMDMMEWRSLQSAMPGQLNQIAKAMGKTTTELGEGLRTGSVSMDDFMNTMVKLNKEGVNGFASFEEQAKSSVGGIKVAFTNFNTAITRGMANCIGSIDKMLANNGLPTIGEMANKASSAVDTAFEKMGSAIESVNFKGIVEGATPYWNAFKTVAGGVGSVIKNVAGFLNDHAETATKLIPIAWGLGAAFGAYNKIASFIPGLKTMSQIFSKMAGGLLAKLAPQLFTTAAAEKAIGTESGKSATNTLKMAVGILAIGAGVLLAGTGLFLMAKGAISLANAGGGAIAVMGGMVLALAGLAIGAAAIGPALTAGAPGLLAFGAAILMVGAGTFLACAGLSMLAGELPVIVTYGAQAAVVIAQLGAGLITFAGGAIAAGVGCVVLGAGLLAAGAGALGASVGFFALGGSMMLVAVFAKSVNSSMKSISKNALAARKSLATMQGSVKVVGSGLDALGNKARSALNKLISSFNNAASKAKSAGQKLGQGFTTGMQGGLNKAPSAASKSVSSVNSRLRSGRSGAYSSGAYISQGFASGMLSQLGTIRSAAAQMAAAADEAVRAKAKIHSPSKVSEKSGEFYGEGWVGGILSKVKDARKAAERLVSLPRTLQAPKLSIAGYGGSLDTDNFEYYGSAEYTIVVPVEIEGKEVAKVTAPYTEAELNKRQQREDRKRGIR